jgi:triacylglycerol esterase/lipase EstA (alpha/beta hydrolase family)
MADGPPLKCFGSRDRENPVADVIFVHGLGGDAIETWSVFKGEKAASNGWPAWLAEDLPSVQVSSVEYDAAATKWVGQPMPLEDRGTNILTRLEASEIGARPIAFICHSLGGLIVKQMLRMAFDTRTQEQWTRIREQTRSVFFVATPHAGADVATLTRIFNLVLQRTILTEQLEANGAALHQLAN